MIDGSAEEPSKRAAAVSMIEACHLVHQADRNLRSASASPSRTRSSWSAARCACSTSSRRSRFTPSDRKLTFRRARS